MKTNYKLLNTSIFTSLIASLCCIMPIIAIIAGTSGIASSFSWLEPLRPYLIGLTIIFLGLAWYQKLKPRNEIDCECDPEKKSFLNSKIFLGIVTIFSALMLSFPYYSGVFIPKNNKQIIYVNNSDIQTINIEISGMTCTGCEEYINNVLNNTDGILNVNASYKDENVIVEFDKSKINIDQIEDIINSTGYKVKMKTI